MSTVDVALHIFYFREFIAAVGADYVRLSMILLVGIFQKHLRKLFVTKGAFVFQLRVEHSLVSFHVDRIDRFTTTLTNFKFLVVDC